MPDKPPYVETEVKIRYPAGADDARHRIEQRGYSLIERRTLESDQLFDRAGGGLRQADMLLRLRRTSSGEKGPLATVTYKGPATRERYKSREEIEFNVSDADAFVRFLERLGYVPGFRYEKYRTKFAAPGEPGIITLDETPIGVYLELEGTGAWIDPTAVRLGLSPSEYLTASYGALYREYLQSHPDAPANMVFDLTP
jgi:adenylate cyclase class 2